MFADVGIRGLDKLFVQYTSPERLRGASVCPADDMYALGILAWQLLDDDDDQARMPHLQLIHQVLENCWRPSAVCAVPEQYRRLMEYAWAPEAELRPKLGLVRQWLLEVVQEMKGMNGNT